MVTRSFLGASMNVIEFLEARIAEDEAVAQAATQSPWEWDDEQAQDEAFLYAPDDAPVIVAYGLHTQGFLECSDEDRTHIVRHDPSRVLAECAAKRAIIADNAEFVTAVTELSAALPGKLNQDPDAPWRTIMLRHLAAVYSNHEDFQEEWAA